MRTAYVAFATDAQPPLTVAGKLGLPAREGRGPAVLICHGSDGVDGRGDYYAPALQAAGIATLEIDMWAARGSARGAVARPRSPLETLPDAFAALAFLARQPEVDGARVGIMGFSWGGVVTLLSATERASGRWGGRFAAHAANYPVCWAFSGASGLSLEGLTGAPILLQTGSADAYDSTGAGPRLAERLRGAEVQAIEYPGAGHGFDRDLPAQTITDPFSHEGVGGEVLMAFDPVAAPAARSRIVGFFQDVLTP